MQKLLCLGDSITDCGHLLEHPPLGNGYVSILAKLLPPKIADLQVINQGYDGFTLSRLSEKAEQIDSFSPDILTILIGINDVSLMLCTGRTPQQKAQMMDTFTCRYQKLVSRITAPRRHLFLIEPFLFPWPAEYKAWMPCVQEMSERIAQLARENKLPYVRTQALLHKEARSCGVESLTPDGIHLTGQGHTLLAHCIYHAIIGEACMFNFSEMQNKAEHFVTGGILP